MEPDDWLHDSSSHYVIDLGYGNAPLPSEPTLAENAGAPAMETEFWSTCELELPQRVDETGNCGVIQYPGTPIVSDPAYIQRPDISGNTMMLPNYIQQDGVRDIGLQSTTPGSHPSSSSTSAMPYTGFPNEPTFHSLHPSSSSTSAMPYPRFLNKLTFPSLHPSSSSTSAMPYPRFLNKLTFPSLRRENYTMREMDMNLTSFGVGAVAERDSLSRLGKSCLTTTSHEDSKNHNHEVVSITANHTPLLSENTRYTSSLLPFKPVDIDENLILILENAYNIDDFSSYSPKKKKTKLLNPDGGNGSKRCNCKKTRCLKLYCKCFAAGVHCSDSCACQGCSNRIEHKDIVLETAKKIRSQNLHAFSKKTTEPSTNNSGEDGLHHKPRHKTGCTCKKSRCLQKYCECYQFGVGCSDRCRCEGCQNSYGKKEDYSMNRILVSKHDDNDNNQILYGEELRMSPSIPSIPYSNNGETAPRSSWLPHVTFQSSEPGTNIQFPSVSTGINQVSFDRGLEYGSQDTPCNALVELEEFTHFNQRNSANVSGGQMFPSNHHLSHGNSTSGYNSIVNAVTHPERNKFLEVYDGSFCNASNDNRLEVMYSLTVTQGSPSPFGITREIGSCSSAGPRKGVKTTSQHGPSISPSTPSNDFQNHDNMNPTDPWDSNRR